MKRLIKILWCTGLIITILSTTACENTTADSPSFSPLPTHQNTIETVSIYTIDTDTMTLVPVKIKKGKEAITRAYITSLVEDSLDDETIRVYSVVQEDNCVFLSFYAKGKPLVNCSKKMENLILDCFANSLLDNLDSCSKIVFRSEDKAYKSENYSFKKNEVYTSE